MKLTRIILTISLTLLASGVKAGEWDFGPGVSYVSGISDVVDLYENNLEADTFSEVDVISIPIGVGFMARYQAESGLMFHIGLGPAFIIAGDADHTEIPFSTTVGYAFARNADTSPYIRIGVVGHSVSGDYVESSDAGVLTAIGVEFGRKQGLNWGIELGVDDSTVEFEDLKIIVENE